MSDTHPVLICDRCKAEVQHLEFVDGAAICLKCAYTPPPLHVYVFHGTRPYGVHVVMAKSLEAACKRVGVPVEKCSEWLGAVHAKYEYEVLEEGEVGDYGE